MPVFLSPEWIAALAAAVELAPLPAVDPFTPFTVRHVVTAAPGGTVVYEIVWAEEQLRVRPGESDRADVVIVTDHATARAINRGELTAQEAIERGRLRVRGEIDRVASARRVLSAVEDHAGDLRAATTYDPAP